MRRRRLLPLLALSLLVPLAGCESTTPEEPIDGVYALETINGATLPWIAIDGAFKVEVLSGSITLTSGGQFTDKTTYRITEAGGTRNEDDIYTGTFVKTSTGATLSPVGGFQNYFVSIAGVMLTQIIEGSSLVYRK